MQNYALQSEIQHYKNVLLQMGELKEKPVVTLCGSLIICLKEGLGREAVVKAALNTADVH